MRNTLIAAAILGACLMAPKIASAQSVTIACEASNFCFSDASGISFDSIEWYGEDSGINALFPQNCGNRNFCRFYCPDQQGFISLTVTYRLAGQTMGSATARTRCTAQDI